MNAFEFETFLKTQKEYKGQTYFNAQLLCLHTFENIFLNSKAETTPPTKEQELYYNRLILGDFIQENPNGNYHLTSKALTAFATLEKELKEKYHLTETQQKAFLSFLMDERKKTEQKHLKSIEHFYHLSPVAPDKMHICEELGVVGIHLKECNDAYSLMSGKFGYVAPKDFIPLCLRKTDFKIYPYVNPTIAVICTHGESFEKSCSPCYEYQVDVGDKKNIHPVIMPWGNAPVEYVSTQPLKIKNLQNPEIQTPETLIKKGVQIYLIDDEAFFLNTTHSTITDSMTLEEKESYFQKAAAQYPDKIKRYQSPKKQKQTELISVLNAYKMKKEK